MLVHHSRDYSVHLLFIHPRPMQVDDSGLPVSLEDALKLVVWTMSWTRTMC